MDVLRIIFQYLIPSGGISAAVLWFVNRTVRQTRISKEIHDTYKTMYEDVQSTLSELQHENKKLSAAVRKLERALSHAANCRYWDSCPIRNQLYKPKSSITGSISSNIGDDWLTIDDGDSGKQSSSPCAD